MNKEIVQAVRRMSLSIPMDRLPDISQEIQTFMDEHPHFEVSPVTIKVLVTSFKFKEDEKAANAILMRLIPEAEIGDLVVIFNKITEYNAEFLGICKRYAGVKRLRPAILAIFRRMGMSCEEAHIYTGWDESMVVSLLRSLDSADFKRTKRAIRKVPIEKYVHLLPELSEQGIRNLREICGSAILEYLGGSPTHSSEIVRVEFFKSLASMHGVLDFFRFNQFICEKNNQLEIDESFKKKLDLFSGQELFGQFIQNMHMMVTKMCRSPCLQRRHLGALLLFSTIPFMPTNVPLPLVYDLIHDKSHEIRGIASPHCGLIKLDNSVHINNLFCCQYGKIAGGTAFLRNSDPRVILEILKHHMADGTIHGLMHCLNEMEHVPSEYSELVDGLYTTYRSCDSTDGWKILKECCVFYHRIGRDEVLMDTLLSTSHLGMICLLRDLIDPMKLEEDAVVSYAMKGIERIRSKDTNDRRSGGLSLYFTLLTRSRRNYPVVRRMLTGLVVDGASRYSGTIRIRKMQESALFHTMNVLIAVFDNSGQEEIPFYMDLGLACLLHDSFSIRNCGCTLLGSVFRKVLSGQKSFDNLFLGFRETRKIVQRWFEEGISTKNPLMIYHILFVYRRTVSIQDFEILLVSRCMRLGGFVKMKAEKILNREPQHNPRSLVTIKFNALDERMILLRTLLILSSADHVSADAVKNYLKAEYGLPKVSSEYTVHLVLEMARARGYDTFIRKKLEAIVEDRSNLCWEDVCDEEDLAYLLELLDNRS